MRLSALSETLHEAVSETGLAPDSGVFAVLEDRAGQRYMSPVVGLELDEEDGSVDLNARHSTGAAGLDVREFMDLVARCLPGHEDSTVFVFGEPQTLGGEHWFREDIPVGIAVFNPSERTFVLAQSGEVYGSLNPDFARRWRSKSLIAPLRRFFGRG